MKKDSKKKFAPTVVLAVFLNLALVFFVCFLFSRIGLRKEEVEESKRRLSYYEKRIENAKNIGIELAKGREDCLKVESIFLDKESFIDFIEELEFLAMKAGVELKMKKISVLGVEKEKPDFNFTLEGSFPDIYYYVVLLENDSYQLEFKKVYIQKTKRAGEWNANLELSLLSFKDD